MLLNLILNLPGFVLPLIIFLLVSGAAISPLLSLPLIILIFWLVYTYQSRPFQVINLGKSFINNGKFFQRLIDQEEAGSEDIKKSREEYKKHEKNNLFVIDFKGDSDCSQLDYLSKEIDVILQAAKPGDEVLLRLDSPGGSVYRYGVAKQTVERIVNRNIFLTVAVDNIAASGGYMMALPANQIIASEFGILGSIGVILPVINFYPLANKIGIQEEVITGGKRKRPLTFLSPITQEGVEDIKERVDVIHHDFKAVVKQYRSEIDIEKMCQGQVVYAKEALAEKLIDKIQISDDFIFDKLLSGRFHIYQVSATRRKESFSKLAENSAINIFNSVFSNSILSNGIKFS